MAKKEDKKTLYDYNIYKIPFDKHDEFVDYLENRHFEEIPLKKNLLTSQSLISFKLMFCDKDNKKGSPWVKLLSSCSEWDLTQDSKIYGAAFICKGKDFCYVVSYGNAHFYLSNYCDYNFGVSIAERLIDLESIKAQQNVSHGNKLSKTHLDYIKNTPLTYGSGEIPTFIKGNSINSEMWGSNINCGISAHFKWEETPLAIGSKLIELERVLKTDSIHKLPKLSPLDNESDLEKIESLYNSLAQSINNYDEKNQNDNYFSVPSFYLLGTRIMQTDFSRYKLMCNRKSKKVDGELNISALKQFVTEKDIDVLTDIRKINISVEYSTDQWAASKPITEFLEYITEDNFCLRNGKWCSFNEYVGAILHRSRRDFTPAALKFYSCGGEILHLRRTDYFEFPHFLRK